MFSSARKVLKAACAASALGAAAVSMAPAPASAGVMFTKSECIAGFWHVMTYDITDPDHRILVEDLPTDQPCGPSFRVLAVAPSFRLDLRRERVDVRTVVRAPIETGRGEVAELRLTRHEAQPKRGFR
jgi:hypothetical protein